MLRLEIPGQKLSVRVLQAGVLGPILFALMACSMAHVSTVLMKCAAQSHEALTAWRGFAGQAG